MSEPFDAEAFITRLQRSTEEHARVTALRPTSQQLSEWLGLGANLLQQALEATRDIAVLEHEEFPRETGIWPPRHGSIGATDRELYEESVSSFVQLNAPSATHWLDTHRYRNPVLWATDHLRRACYTITDCLAGIAGLMGRDDTHHLRASIVLARSAFECAAWSAFITSPSIDSTERLRRILNLQFEEIQETLNSRGADGDGDEGRADLIAFAEHCGMKVRTGRRSWLAPVILAPGRTQPDSARHVIDQVLPEIGVDMWRSLSAVAHGREAPIVIPDEFSRPSELKPWQRMESISWHTLPALLLTQQLCTHMQDYLGWETHEWGEGLLPVSQALSIAAGLHDNAIRASLGLGPVGT